ncbi:MAG: putative inner membrane transporter YhbE [Chroococcidiopsis sp. SAG 2025]|uniref:DMT family transporter n=1 Tax=Chroococcidiopsis sp. SAG 2025 TaxID=171389 RepID=UPI0029372B67|nr:DMT family transporter [Chroococcidiopsis sp. SAG 2025]MDV2991283.1 putative inner membrane transporter YhbE [Chroococcidiopsis sp. SAG 2025]
MITYIKLVLTAIIWGGTFVAGRIVVQTMEPFTAAFFRFAVASICLLILTQKIERRLYKLTRNQAILVILLGLTGVFSYNAFFFLGLQTVPASRAALIVALNPTFIALGAALFFREKFNSLKLLGITTSLTGAAIVISKGQIVNIFKGSIGWGEVFIFGCVLSWVAYTLIGKSVMKSLSPLAATTYACIIGAIALLIPALFEGITQDFMQFPLAAWLGIFYLGVLGSAIGFNWYYEGVVAIGAAKASIFINLVPVSAIAFAALLLQEPITVSLVLGGVLVVVGVFFTNKS